MKQITTILCALMLFACSNALDTEVLVTEIHNEPIILMPIDDSASTVATVTSLDPTIANYGMYDGPYDMTVTVGSAVIGSYDNSASFSIRGSIPIQYIVHKHTLEKKVLTVGSVSTSPQYMGTYVLWLDLGSRAWSTIAFTNYDQLSSYVNFVIYGKVTAPPGFFNPYEQEDYIINHQSYININHEY